MIDINDFERKYGYEMALLVLCCRVFFETATTDELKTFFKAVETERVILLLYKNNIDSIPYKGMAFSKQFFGDLISRESSDIDLVIKPTDLERAVQILKEDEYLPELDDVYQYLGSKFQSYNKDYNFNKFNNNSRIYHLELHWAIAENYLGASNRVNQFHYQANTQTELAKTNVKALNEVSHFSAILNTSCCE
jgi:hypothetical protein